MKKIYISIVMFILSCVIIFAETSYTRILDNGLEWTMSIEHTEFIGEPIPIRILIKNITNTEIITDDLSEHSYEFPAISSENFINLIVPLPAMATHYPKKITLKPGEYRICDYLKLPELYGENYKKYGFLNGNYIITFGGSNSNIRININIDNDFSDDIINLYKIFNSQKNYKNIEPIIDIHNKLLKCENTSVKCAADYYMLKISYYHRNNVRNHPENYKNTKTIYQINKDFKSIEAECRKFLNNYPDNYYYTIDVKKMLLNEIADKGKIEFEKFMKNEYSEMHVNNQDYDKLIEKYQEQFKKEQQ